VCAVVSFTHVGLLSGSDQIVVHTLIFDGVQSVDEDQLRAVVHNQPRSWLPWHSGRFERDAVDADLRRIEAFYRHHGFPDARIVSFHIDFDLRTRSVDLYVAIEERPSDGVYQMASASVRGGERGGSAPRNLGRPAIAASRAQ
jgi:outer membrane protein assembly factor BamA